MKVKINKLTLAISIIVFLIFSGLAFLFGEYIKLAALKTYLTALSSTVASIGGITFIWEIIAKRTFATDIYKMAQISSNLKDSGIENVYYYNDVNWKNELQDTKNLKIFFAYGNTFRINNREELKKLSSLTIFLPNFENDTIVSNLDYRFSMGKYSNKSEESVKIKICRAICEFKELGAKVYLHNMIQTHTLYMLDKQCFLATYKHFKGRSNVLTLKANKDGVIKRFIKEELDFLLNNSTEVSEAELNEIETFLSGGRNE